MAFPTVSPVDAGFDPDRLQDAIRFAQANESKMDRDIGAALGQGHFGEPWPIGQTIGPVKERADPSGVILRDGKHVASWGDPTRVDMTFSISKSYLALLSGIAVDDGLIPDIHAPVRNLVEDGGFDGPNASITWAHLLQLTSEWQGTLWDKPDWIDHYRDLDSDERPPIGTQRPLQSPGTFWEYNDVRVNRLALALLQVFKRPLPEVLKERIMDPIGASATWEWHGYSNSWVEIDGERMQSVSGGAHWGGGLWISALDHARVGQLMLQNGVWGNAQILSENWIKTCRTPCALNPQYGALWWLNTDQSLFPSLPASSFFGIGVGSQVLWIAPDQDLVVIARWVEKDSVDAVLSRILTALNAQ